MTCNKTFYTVKNTIREQFNGYLISAVSERKASSRRLGIQSFLPVKSIRSSDNIRIAPWTQKITAKLKITRRLAHPGYCLQRRQSMHNRNALP